MRGERGTTMVEFALALTMILMLAIGAFEWGLGFIDRLSVSQAVRESARVGAALGDYHVDKNNNADCGIIEAGAGALSAIGGKQVKELWIYESDVNGSTTGPKQRYRPAVAGDNPLLLACGSGWYRIENNWDPTVRDSSGGTRDWIGVRVVLDHEWKTNFLWWNGTVEWQESVVFHLEPKVVN